ncbi:MAG: DUF86 domain-containing protein [Dysgonamonadaceae bacterium]|jgi:uncharacterized protein with HEPN domain|nr:DUF86 domain-containing protein [Dysgonamonadaceae bacterium]
MDKASKYLFDIRNAIALTEEFLKGIIDFRTYQMDLKTQSAVERQLSVIGEAVNKLRSEEIAVTLSSASQIVGFRNRLIHSYDNIDASIVWAIIKNHLPQLKIEVEALFEQ